VCLQAGRDFSPNRNRPESPWQAYWYPLYARPALGCGEEETQDLTQQFFVRFVGANTFNSPTLSGPVSLLPADFA